MLLQRILGWIRERLGRQEVERQAAQSPDALAQRLRGHEGEA